jgi:hypothetical protein
MSGGGGNTAAGPRRFLVKPRPFSFKDGSLLFLREPLVIIEVDNSYKQHVLITLSMTQIGAKATF